MVSAGFKTPLIMYGNRMMRVGAVPEPPRNKGGERKEEAQVRDRDARSG